MCGTCGKQTSLTGQSPTYSSAPARSTNNRSFDWIWQGKQWFYPQWKDTERSGNMNTIAYNFNQVNLQQTKMGQNYMFPALNI